MPANPLIPTSPAPPWQTPPTATHLAQITLARSRGTKIRRASLCALISGWTLAVFAFLPMLFSITSPDGLILGTGMAIVSFIELRGAGELKRLDSTAPRRLALNQAALGVMLFLYGAYRLWLGLNDPSPLPPELAM